MSDNAELESNIDGSEVRTLFVSGLPSNVRPREIYLLFRGYEGYEGYQLKPTDKQGKPSPVAFVKFETREEAEECKTNLQGVRFDPDLNQTLRIEYAKTNTKMSTLGPPKHMHLSLPIKTVGPHEALTPLDLAGLSFVAQEQVWHHARMPFADSPGSPLPSPLHSPVINHFPHTVQHALYQPLPNNLTSNAYSLRPQHANVMSNENSVCPTLFVANLGKTCTETDLHNIFARTPGFRKLKMLKGNAPCSFVEYQDIFTAAHAMSLLQGQILPSSEPTRGGIRIEYARSRMGEPRYPMLNGDPVMTSVPSIPSPLGPPINITTYS